MDPDLILVFKMKQGSDAAWEQFIRKYYADILKYCFFHTRERSISEDLTQEVFLRFFTALPGYQHRGKAKNYLYTIAANLCRNQRAFPPSLPLDPEISADPAPAVEQRLTLEAAVGRLPEEFRELVVLHYYQGLKITEAAAVLQIGLPLAKYRLKRARELLRKELDYGDS